MSKYFPMLALAALLFAPPLESGAGQPSKIGIYSRVQRRGCKIYFPRVAA